MASHIIIEDRADDPITTLEDKQALKTLHPSSEGIEWVFLAIAREIVQTEKWTTIKQLHAQREAGKIDELARSDRYRSIIEEVLTEWQINLVVAISVLQDIVARFPVTNVEEM